MALITGSGATAKTYFYHANHLYSVAALTDNTGSVVERYRYDAYGKRTVTNAGGTPTAANTIGLQRGFTGYYLDAETGLYSARSRMYSAKLGQFISRGKAGYVDGLSLYRGYFVPLGLDPFGHENYNGSGEAGGGKLKVALAAGIGFDFEVKGKRDQKDCPCDYAAKETAFKFDLTAKIITGLKVGIDINIAGVSGAFSYGIEGPSVVVSLSGQATEKCDGSCSPAVLSAKFSTHIGGSWNGRVDILVA